MQATTIAPTGTSARTETPADVRQRRLEAQVQRWEKICAHYRSRGMRTQLRHAVTVLERSRAALSNA